MSTIPSTSDGAPAQEYTKIIADCAFSRPAGRVTLAQATTLVAEAILLARSQNVPKLLFNALGLTGFPSPTLAERYFFARRWAAIAQGRVQLALVVESRMIDPERFGVTVARNAGMDAEVFDNEPAALAWLLLPAAS